MTISIPGYGEDPHPGEFDVPRTFEDWNALRKMSAKELDELGFTGYGHVSDKNIWLLPWDWYSYIPKGFTVTNVCGDDIEFDPRIHLDPMVEEFYGISAEAPCPERPELVWDIEQISFNPSCDQDRVLPVPVA